MHGKLIDDENYPRSDIDVYAVRVARNRIICKEDNFLCQKMVSFFLKAIMRDFFNIAFGSVIILCVHLNLLTHSYSALSPFD